jgi:hypothetical protein
MVEGQVMNECLTHCAGDSDFGFAASVLLFLPWT